MNILVIDDPLPARWLAINLKPHLGANMIETASPRQGEGPQIFAKRVLGGPLNRREAEDTLLVVHANLRCGHQDRSSFLGLEVLELLLSEKAAPAIILSFIDDPIRQSEDQRLVDEGGEILLRHFTISNIRLPTSTGQLVKNIKLASKWLRLSPDRSTAFRFAFYQRMTALIRHRHKNLRAASRMLDGAIRLNLVTRKEYCQIIDSLKEYHPLSKADLEQSQRGIENLPWPERIEAPPLAKKVLLVDDEAESCAWKEIITPLCRSIGADLESVITLEQAEIKLLDSPDAVLLDLHYRNVDSPPDPFEVLSRMRAANPFVPIIIFTTEQEGRYVRDLGKDAFHYFFKEVNEVAGADTRMYAEKFRRVLQSAMEKSLPTLLTGLVELSLPSVCESAPKFDRVRDLLGLAASAIWIPEVALCLTTGAVTESRVAVGDPRLGAAWTHLTNLFEVVSLNGDDLRKMLPEIVRAYRNYASHYEQPHEPPPTTFDAVAYLLLATLFVADLQAIVEGGHLNITKQSVRWRSLNALGRVAQELSSTVKSPLVLDSPLLEKLQNLAVCSERDLRYLLETKCQALQNSGRIPFSNKGVGLPAFSNVLGVLFGNSVSNLPTVEWRGGQHVAPYLIYVCSFLILERVAQMDRDYLIE